MNTQSEKSKFFSTKTVLKKNRENPNAPLRMNRSVQSTNHTNDNRTTITINETSTKTFFLNFQSETCCKPTLVTRYYSGKVSCHAIELFIDYEHRCLTIWKLPNGISFFKLYICIYGYM